MTEGLRYKGARSTAGDLLHNVDVLEAELERVSLAMKATVEAGDAPTVDEYLRVHALARTIADLNEAVRVGSWGG